jgi:carbon-monoxide dehydrogenase medium subunit
MQLYAFVFRLGVGDAMVTIVAPTSIAEAVDIVRRSDGEAKYLGGGTALVLLLSMRMLQPEVLVSLRGIADVTGWDRVGVSDGEVRIGAGATLTDVALDATVQTRLPSLARAAAVVGNTRIRNVATIGGMLAEADYASDPPATLVSLGASVVMTNGERERIMPVSEFVTDFFTTELEPEEIVTAVTVPVADGAGHRSTYERFCSRSAEDRPCVGVAASGMFEDDELRSLRIAIGAVAGRPQWFPEITDPHLGRPLDDDAVAQISAAYADAIDPIDDLRGSAWYRREVTRVQVERALTRIRAVPA